MFHLYKAHTYVLQPGICGGYITPLLTLKRYDHGPPRLRAADRDAVQVQLRGHQGHRCGGGAAGLRVHLGLRPLLHDRRVRGDAMPRVLDDPRRPSQGHAEAQARPHGLLPELPKPGAHGEDRREPRQHKWRQGQLRRRRGVEGGRVQSIRVPVPLPRHKDQAAERLAGDSEEDVDGGEGHLRGQVLQR